jgi:molecular chaperone HscC
MEAVGSGGISGGRLLPVIERNTVVPVSRVQTVTPVRDFQAQVDVRIYQGESRLVKDNIPLGKLMLQLKPRHREEQTIEVRFTYDINGLLEVSARSVVDGVAEQIIIEQHAGALTADEVAERMASLAHLKLPARETAQNRLLIARAERAYEESLGNTREQLARCIAQYEAALAHDDREYMAIAGAELEDMIETSKAARTR